MTMEAFVVVSSHRLEVRALPAKASAEALAPIVLLHEGLGSAQAWRDLPEALHDRTGGRTVIAYSRPGYGRSSPARLPRRVRYMHDEALEVLPRLLACLGLDRPVLVGHSDGASITLVHAGASRAELPTDLEPERFWPPRALVAIAPHVVVEDRSIEGIEAARTAYLHGDLRRRLARHHHDVDATFWGWNDAWLSAEFRSWSIEKYLPRIQCPILLIQGEEDEYGTMGQLTRIESLAGGPVSRLVVPGAGHAPHRSHPDLVISAIVRFLATVESTAENLAGPGAAPAPTGGVLNSSPRALDPRRP
jgi:pimeloyl-ACP methyl ester carboxylesterase